MAIVNAREEFQRHVTRTVKCVSIRYEKDFETQETIELRVGYTVEEMEQFLTKLGTINYDNGYGTQHIFGKIWYDDGNWSSRAEYDGSEWWEGHVTPFIPDHLKGDNND